MYERKLKPPLNGHDIRRIITASNKNVIKVKLKANIKEIINSVLDANNYKGKLETCDYRGKSFDRVFTNVSLIRGPNVISHEIQLQEAQYILLFCFLMISLVYLKDTL